MTLRPIPSIWLDIAVFAISVLLLTATILPRTGTATDHAFADAIRDVLMDSFDKPEARLTVAPIAVIGIHGLAGWTQGDRGGRALLRRSGHGWVVVACGGDGLKELDVLRDAGLPAVDAVALVRAMDVAEARLPAEQRALFSTFDGLLRLDGPPGHAGAHGAHPAAPAASAPNSHPASAPRHQLHRH
ncbi:copper uptake system-associated protein [Ideonella sp. A 288]|uniref:copper uptake system-associated protein n=1 Tax=Ideonella sp. A 288 TaxID=1962181 RepID=UPI001184A629|nr:copper uptake system-associated protein [Ideonella sp. A 288]